ncbi:MAG: hypothetical protein IT186_15400 [Acidobacteria bacterium]|nr:hypothetical protein [Acidobacteriota bacterium]
MSSDLDPPARPAGSPPIRRIPALVLAAASLVVPGLGHVLSGTRWRGVLLLLVVSSTLAIGLFLGGQVPSPAEGNPLSWIAAGAGWCSGALYFPARALARPASPSATSEIGSIYILSAGAMSLLAFFDVLRSALSKREDNPS